MKLPLAESPFPQLALTHDECEDYERVATARLLETVAEFEAFVHTHKRAMHKKQWKAVKSRESLTVYKRREGEVLKLVGVGSIVGNLDDVMYGIVAPASECVKIKTSYVEDDVLDDMLLQQLQYASVDDPYKFLGVKWLAKAGASAVASPRDFVVLEATGTHELAAGERIGYQITHSVDIPECRDLKDLGLQRALTSSSYLFKQLANGTVEVYMKASIDPTGGLPERMAVSEMLDVEKAIWCAQNKKLAWLKRDAAVRVRHQNRQRGRDEFSDYVGTMKTDAKGKHCCGLCTQKFSAFRTAVTCELCKTIVCSRCKTARKLTYVHGGTKVTKIPAALCKNCVTNANNMSSIEFARSEYVSPDVISAHYQSPAPSVVSSSSSRRRPTVTSSTDMSSSRGLRKQTSDDWRQLSLAETDASSLPAWSMDGSEESERSYSRDSVEVDTMDNWSRRPPATHDQQWETKGQMIVLKQPRTAPMTIQETACQPQPKPKSQQELWAQMNQLRLQAEQVYRITRENNHVMAETKPRQW